MLRHAREKMLNAVCTLSVQSTLYIVQELYLAP